MAKAAGDWLHTQGDGGKEILELIRQNGWKPESNTGTKYGCGVYLSRVRWHSSAKHALRCSVGLADEEIMDHFEAVPGYESKGAGNTEGHLARYLEHAKVISNNRPPTSAGDSEQNRRIRDHFLGRNIRAVKIQEHGLETLIVFDRDAISIDALI